MYDPLKKKDYVYSGKLGSHISDFIAEKRVFGCLYNTEAKKLSEFSRITLNYDFPDDTLTQEVVEAWLTRRSTDADKTLYNRYKADFGPLTTETITDHKQIAENVYMTEFSNGTKVYVNYRTLDYKANGLTIPAQDWVIETGKGGN